jgi:DNA-binding NtrC family response regulator
MAKVLLIDDQMTMVQMLGELLRAEDHQVVPFTNSSAAAEKLASVGPDLIIATVGSERARAALWTVLQRARALTPTPALLLVTTSAGSDLPLEAMKRGAYDCVSKPFTVEELKLRLQRALSYQAALAENLALRKQLQSDVRFHEIITRSLRMQSVVNLAEHLADSNVPLLLQGPVGTGKRLLARTIHFNSRRRLAPFLCVDCAAVPEDLLEGELFGQRKLLFGTETEEKPGIFKEADSGTVYLSNLGSLPTELQVRLMQWLQRNPTPGEANPVPLDVRLLASHPETLEAAVNRGTFIRELHAHLNKHPLVLPSLRERAEDVPVLIAHFLQGRIHARSGQPYGITAEALQLCCEYSWPGNIAELENCLHQACLVSQDHNIHPGDLPRIVQQPSASEPDVRTPNNGQTVPERRLAPCHRVAVPQRTEGTLSSAELVPLKKFLRDQEVYYLQRALAEVGGSKERAAEVLGISLATIYRKLSEPTGACAALQE